MLTRLFWISPGDDCATVLASGLIPIQLEYYYFEFHLKELGDGAEVIIGCQIHGHELDQESDLWGGGCLGTGFSLT